MSVILLTRKQIAERLNCSVGWVDKLNNQDPTFPKKIPIGLTGTGGRAPSPRWVESDFNAWLENKINASRKGTKHEDRRTGGDVHQSQGEEAAAEG